MHRRIATLVSGMTVAAIVAACAASAGSPIPSSTTDDGPAPAYRLRATTTQAVPPVSRFGWLPSVAITGDLQVVTAGPMIEIYPGPLLPNLVARSISPGGYARIVDGARSLGLLAGDGDFTPQDVLPGASLGRIELVVDGVLHDLRGDPGRLIQCVTTPCVPPPGTPEAFATFWGALSDLSWLGGDLGPEQPYVAPSYALLVGIEPAEDPALPPNVIAWPLDTPLAAFGRPVGQAANPRCGTVRGDDAITLRPALGGANQLTRWVDGVNAAAPGSVIEVRPMIPGEDVCRELFGFAG